MRTRWLWWGAATVGVVVVLGALGLGGWWWAVRVTPVRAAAPGQFVGFDRVEAAVGRLTGVSEDGDALGQGSAFFVGPETVATAWHVVHLMSGGSAQVEMADGRVFEVTRVLGVDERVDLAVVRVSPANEGAVLALAPAAGVDDPAEALTVVTTPLLFERTRAGGSGRILQGTPFYGRLLVMEAATAPGWSGSPVVDALGRVRGVVAMGGLTVTMGAPGDLIEGLARERGTALARTTGVPRSMEGLVVLRHRLAEMERGSNPAEAIHSLREMLTFMPDHWPTRELLGELLIERGSHEQGLEELEQAAWLSPYPRWQFQRLAEEYEKLGRKEEAAEARARAEEMGSARPDPLALVKRGAAHAEAGELAEAVAAFTEAVELMPDNALARLMLGQVLVQDEQFGAAEPHLRLAAERRGDAESRWYLALTLVAVGKNAEAEGLLRDLIDQEPENDQYHMNLGNVLRELGRLEESEEQLRRAIEIAPEWKGNHMFLAETLLAAGRGDDAVEAYRRAVRLDPSWERGAVGLAQMLVQLGRRAEAEAELRSFLEREEGSGLVRRELGKTLWQSERVDESIEQLRLAVEAAPDHARSHHALGYALRLNGEYEAAAESLRKAAALDPNSDEIASLLGDLLLKIGHGEEAESLLRERLRERPDSVALNGQLGLVLLNTERASEGVAPLRRAVELDPESRFWHYWLGLALQQSDRLVEAEASLRLAMKFNPGEEAAERLASVLVGLDRNEEAETVLREFLTREPDAGLVHGRLGAVLREVGRPAEAVEHLRRGVTSSPGYAPWRIDLAAVLHDTGLTEEGLGILEEGIGLDERSGKLRERAVWFAATLGLREKAAGHMGVLREVDAEAAGRLEGEFGWLREEGPG